MKFARLLVAGAVVGSGVTGFVACSSDADPIAVDEVEGEWKGTTSQGRAIAFTVNALGVTDAQFGYAMSGSCTFTTVQDLTTENPLPIVDGRFTTGRTQVGGSVFVTASGEFSSASAATGTVVVQHAPCGDTLNLTWTAAKE